MFHWQAVNLVNQTGDRPSTPLSTNTLWGRLQDTCHQCSIWTIADRRLNSPIAVALCVGSISWRYIPASATLPKVKIISHGMDIRGCAQFCLDIQYILYILYIYIYKAIPLESIWRNIDATSVFSSLGLFFTSCSYVVICFPASCQTQCVPTTRQLHTVPNASHQCGSLSSAPPPHSLNAAVQWTNAGASVLWKDFKVAALQDYEPLCLSVRYLA